MELRKQKTAEGSPLFSIKTRLLKIVIAFFLIGWTAILLISFYVNIKHHETHIMDFALAKVRMLYHKDLLYRQWNALMGGVYISTTKIKPNPYLKVKDRDILTTDGKELTLVNPAYMTRQVYELEKKRYGIMGHLTSLTPKNPGNKPDKWETAGLKAFEKGETEYSTVIQFNGMSYLRLMKPFITEKDCLKCHAEQGYQIGQVRGGISTALSIEQYKKDFSIQYRSSALIHTAIWILGLLFMLLGFHKILLDQRQIMASENQLKLTNASKDKFFSILAHDLRGPIASFLGVTDLLINDIASLTPEQLKDFAIEMNLSAENLHQLLENILTWSRSQTGRLSFQPERIDVKDFLEKELPQLKTDGDKKQIQIQTSLLENLAIKADIQALRLIIRNLVSNAIKFTKPGGTIQIGSQSQSGAAAISIEDTGIGIPPENLAKLFRVDAVCSTPGTNGEQGTGLGLILVKEFIEKCKGEIQVKSEVGKGSTFTLTFQKG